MAFDWNEAAVYNLTSLWREGLPFSVIAKRLGCKTRNIVIGKAHRLGLRRGNRSEGAQVNRTVKSRKYNPFTPRPAQRKNEPNLAARAAKQAAKDTRSTAATTPYAGALNITIGDLRSQHCRYPMSGEGADTLFCGAPKARGAWCAHHYALVYQAGKAR